MTARDHHQLFEWQSLPLGPAGITEAAAARLVRAAAGSAARLGGQRAFDFGRDTITARNLVGVVAAGAISCEILPKVDGGAGTADAPPLRRQLIRMLALAHDLPIADDAATMLGTQGDTLLEVLIARFIALLRDAVRQGLPRAYVDHRDDLPALRGRLDPVRQFTTLAATPHRLACRYDEFSPDILLNRLMKAAVMRLRTLATSPANARALTELALIYADVGDASAASLARMPPFDRSNARWATLGRMAWLILGDRFQNTARGATDGFALLFDMNALFERYVARLIGPPAARRGWTVVAQGGHVRCLYPEDGSPALFSTVPDLLVQAAGATRMVVDTKWKRLSDRSVAAKMEVAEADLYQAMAYAQLYRCDHVVLLYPHHPALTSPMPAHHRIGGRDGAVRLTIATIDLADHATARAGLATLLDGEPVPIAA